MLKLCTVLMNKLISKFTQNYSGLNGLLIKQVLQLLYGSYIVVDVALELKYIIETNLIRAS